MQQRQKILMQPPMDTKEAETTEEPEETEAADAE